MLSPPLKTPCSRITESPGPRGRRRSLLVALAELDVRVDPHLLLALLVLVPGGSLVQWIALEVLVDAATAAAAKHCHITVRKFVGCCCGDTFDFLFL